MVGAVMWISIPLMVIAFLLWTGIPLWLVFRNPDWHPALSWKALTRKIPSRKPLSRKLARRTALTRTALSRTAHAARQAPAPGMLPRPRLGGVQDSPPDGPQPPGASLPGVESIPTRDVDPPM